MKVSRNIEDYVLYPEFDSRSVSERSGRTRIYCDNAFGYLSPEGTISQSPCYWNTKQEAEDFLKEFCMENYAMIEGKKVKLSDETIKELKKALIPEETYQVGDVLISQSSDYKVMIVHWASNRVGLICIGEGPSKGQRYSSAYTTVQNIRKITKKELGEMTHSHIKWEKVCE